MDPRPGPTRYGWTGLDGGHAFGIAEGDERSMSLSPAATTPGRLCALANGRWFPAAFAEPNPVAVGADACSGVVDHADGEVVEGEPGEGGAFVGFLVGGFADPAGGGEEESEAGFRAGALDVDGVDAGAVGGVDEDADFFVGFAGCGGGGGFACVEFAGG